MSKQPGMCKGSNGTPTHAAHTHPYTHSHTRTQHTLTHRNTHTHARSTHIHTHTLTHYARTHTHALTHAHRTHAHTLSCCTAHTYIYTEKCKPKLLFYIKSEIWTILKINIERWQLFHIQSSKLNIFFTSRL